MNNESYDLVVTFRGIIHEELLKQEKDGPETTLFRWLQKENFRRSK